MMHHLDTRSRLTLFVALSAVPLLALALYSGLERRAQAVDVGRAGLAELAALAANHHEKILDGARQSALALAVVADPLGTDPRRCQDALKRMIERSGGWYEAIGIHGADGFLFCGTPGSETRSDVRERRYFRAALETGKFVVGGYQIDPSSGQQGVVAAHAALDAQGKAMGVVSVRLSLKKLQETLGSGRPLPRGGQLTLVDADGVILAERPPAEQRIGKRISNPRVAAAIRTAGERIFATEETDGTRRVVAVRAVGSAPEGGAFLHVVMSAPARVVFADANSVLLQTVVGMVLAAILLVLGAFYGAEAMVLRRIRDLLGMTNRIRAGDLTARTGFTHEQEELSQLGHALDEMAQALQKRDVELKRALRELSEQVITDPLTGLHNRRYLWDFLGRDMVRARRAVLPVAAILFDIDHFKRFNDKWGHEAGDLVLKSVAQVVKHNVRGSDIACRYGGEEFIVILPEATMQVAVDRANKIRRGIAQMQLMFSGKPLEAVSASFGIALYPTHADSDEALVRAADEALYLAKTAGRNRVQVYHGAQSPF